MAPWGFLPIQWVSKWTVPAKWVPFRVCYLRCPQKDSHTHTHTHTKTRPSEVIDWTRGSGLWDLDWFQIATELYHVLKCVFPASRALCLLGVHYYFDYYYYCSCLWLLLLLFVITACWRIGRFVCPLMQKKNKLLLLILFQEFRFWNMLPPSFPTLLLTLVFVRPHLFLFFSVVWGNSPEKYFHLGF